VEQAIEQLFLLHDPNDVFLEWTTEGVVVNRIGVLFLSSFQEIWTFTLTPEHGGKRVNVDATMTVDTIRMPVRGVGHFALLFVRLDYLLGASDTWMTCADWEAQHEHEPTWATNTLWWC
jgi:myo-inositol-hexaphosphate 3-phosphohydrolase